MKGRGITGRKQRVAGMLGSAAEASERDAEELADLVGKSEHSRLLTATASAAGSAWPPKVRALGRALAVGLIAEDNTQINIADLVLLGRLEETIVTLQKVSELLREARGWRGIQQAQANLRSAQKRLADKPPRVAPHWLGSGNRLP